DTCRRTAAPAAPSRRCATRTPRIGGCRACLRWRPSAVGIWRRVAVRRMLVGVTDSRTRTGAMGIAKFIADLRLLHERAQAGLLDAAERAEHDRARDELARTIITAQKDRK